MGSKWQNHLSPDSAFVLRRSRSRSATGEKRVGPLLSISVGRVKVQHWLVTSKDTTISCVHPSGPDQADASDTSMTLGLVDAFDE